MFVFEFVFEFVFVFVCVIVCVCLCLRLSLFVFMCVFVSVSAYALVRVFVLFFVLVFSCFVLLALLSDAVSSLFVCTLPCLVIVFDVCLVLSCSYLLWCRVGIVLSRSLVFALSCSACPMSLPAT